MLIYLVTLLTLNLKGRKEIITSDTFRGAV